MSLSGRKTSVGTRAKPRVDPDIERRKATNKKVLPKATARIVEGGVEISSQMSETVPVADYANVVLGPIGVSWVLGDVDMNALAEVDWDLDDDGEFDLGTLSGDQLAAFKRVRNALRATALVVRDSIAEDRELVHQSIERNNKKEAALAKEERKGNGSRRR